MSTASFWLLARLAAWPRIPKPFIYKQVDHMVRLVPPVTSVADPAWCLCISLAPVRFSLAGAGSQGARITGLHPQCKIIKRLC